MDRNDQIFAVALAALVFGVAVAIAGPSYPGVFGSTAAAWVQAAGVFLAVFLSNYLGRKHAREEASARKRDAERIIAARVAARLRPWLRIAVERLIQVQQFESSDGHDGDEELNIPPFDVDLDLAALLSGKDARRIFSLLELRERYIEAIAGTANYVDYEAARRDFYSAIVYLFDRVRKLYRQLAQDGGLHPGVTQKWELAAIDRARADIRAAAADVTTVDF